MMASMTLTEASDRVGVRPATLRWVGDGLIPQYDGDWTLSAIGTARVVARMREREHWLKSIKRATEEGRLAFGFLEDLFPSDQRRYTLKRAADEPELEPGLVERIVTRLGITPEQALTISEDEVQLLRRWGRSSSPGSRWSRCCSSCACTAKGWRGWPTPKCASFTCTCTSR